MNHYETLGIDNNSDIREIKKAYAKMIRKYPPEDYPEEFNKIRKAYDILSNADKKAEYDAYSNHNVEIQEYQNSAELCMDNDQFEEAIKYYKKILVIEPKLAAIKNQLALAYGYNENYYECIKLLTDLTNDYPDNYLYSYNLGHAYLKINNKEEAIRNWKKTLKLDPTYMEACTYLVNLLVELNRSEEAEAILLSKAKGIENLHYYFELLKFYLKIEDEIKISGLVESIFYLSDVEEERDDLAFEICKFCYDTKGPFKIRFSVLILEKLLVLYPDYSDAQNLLESRKARLPICNQYISFCKNHFYEDYFVRYIYMNICFSDFPEEEYEKIIDEILADMKEAAHTNPKKTIDMLNSLKKDFIDLYNLQKEYFSSLYKYSETWFNRYSNNKILQADRKIPYSFKRLINLWLNDSISDEDRNIEFRLISSEMEQLGYGKIKSSIALIKKNYPFLYALNVDYLDSVLQNRKNKKERFKISIRSIILYIVIIRILYAFLKSLI